MVLAPIFSTTDRAEHLSSWPSFYAPFICFVSSNFMAIVALSLLSSLALPVCLNPRVSFHHHALWDLLCVRILVGANNRDADSFWPGAF